MKIEITIPLTPSEIHVGYKDGEAMAFHDSIDFTPFAGALGNTPHQVIFLDAVGKSLVFWIGASGGGETLEADLFAPGFDFTSGFAGNNATINDADTYTNTAATGGVRSGPVMDYGSIYKSSFTATPSAGVAKVVGFGGYPTFAENGDSGTYGTCFVYGAYSQRVYVTTVGGGIGAVTDVSVLTVQKVTDCAGTGVHLYSEQDGSSRGAVSMDAGFYPGNITSMVIRSVEAVADINFEAVVSGLSVILSDVGVAGVEFSATAPFAATEAIAAMARASYSGQAAGIYEIVTQEVYRYRSEITQSVDLTSLIY